MSGAHVTTCDKTTDIFPISAHLIMSRDLSVPFIYSFLFVNVNKIRFNLKPLMLTLLSAEHAIESKGERKKTLTDNNTH